MRVLIELLLLVGLAVEGARIPGSTLIHQNNVAVGLHVAKDLADLPGHFGRALAGSAGEEEERVGRRFAPQAGEQDDFERQLPAGACGAVLPDVDLTAVSVGGAVGAGTEAQAVQRRGGRAQARTRRGEQNEEEKSVVSR